MVANISPHKSFNTSKGVIYCRDLYEFTEEEILNRCPEQVLNVKKLKGINNAILLRFHSSFLPDYINISHISLTVKKFKGRPTQCHNCFEYGHVKHICKNQTRCFICSDIHDLSEACKKDKFCLHCKGQHSPNWKNCPYYKFEMEAVETASNEHISIGAAKNILRKTKNPLSTYAKAAQLQNSKVDNSTSNMQAVIKDPSFEQSKKTNDSNPSNKPINAVRPKNIIPELNEGYWSLPKPTESRPALPKTFVIETSNPFDVLSSLNSTSGINTNYEEVEDDPVHDTKLERRKRGIERESPPKSKKPNVEDDPTNTKDNEMELLVEQISKPQSPTFSLRN